MSYTKQTHVAGQKLTAAQLNYMENGIVAAQNAYNLLDNSDFKNPVNQRGLSSTTTSQTYIIDRWKTDIANNAATVSINSNGITCASTSTNYAGIRQNFAKYSEMVGKTYTLAVCVSGVWEAITFIMGNHSGGSLLSNGTSFFSVEYGHIIIRSTGGATITFEKVALYEGSYTTETLPVYVPKGYGAELYECKRYFQKNTSQGKFFGDTAGNAGYVYVPYEQEMRAIPTLSVTANGSLIGEQAQGLTISSTPVAVNSSTTGMTVQVPNSSNTYILCSWSEPSFTLSAEL